MKDNLGVVDQLREQGLIKNRVDEVLEAGIFFGLANVVHASGREIVDNGYIVLLAKQKVGKMRADETRPTCDQNAHEAPQAAIVFLVYVNSSSESGLKRCFDQ